MNRESTNALVGPLDADVAIKSRILTVRGVQVMLDRDLAELYGVPTKVLSGKEICHSTGAVGT